MTSFGIGIVVNAIARDVKQSAILNPKIIRWYADQLRFVVTVRRIMKMINADERKDTMPVIVGMMIPVFVK